MSIDLSDLEVTLLRDVSYEMWRLPKSMLSCMLHEQDVRGTQELSVAATAVKEEEDEEEEEEEEKEDRVY